MGSLADHKQAALAQLLGNPPGLSMADLETAYWSQVLLDGGSGGPTGYINVMDPTYGVVGDGVADDTAALYAAVEAARNAGKGVYFPAGKYFVTGTITNSNSRKALVVRTDGPLTEFIMGPGAWGTSLFFLQGSLDAAVTITAATAIGANVLTVTSTATMSPGQMILLRDNSQPLVGNTGRTTAALMGEWAQIRTVDSATQITVYETLDIAYTANNSDVRVLSNPMVVDVDGVYIRNSVPGTLPTTARGFLINYSQGIRIRNSRFLDMDAPSIYMQFGTDAVIENCRFRNSHDLEQGTNPYCVSIGRAMQDVLVQRILSRYGRHAVTTNPTATDVAPCYIKVSDSIATEHTEAGFDTHPGTRKVTYENCEVHGSWPGVTPIGFQMRGPDHDVIGCKVSNINGIGFSFINGADRGRLIGGRASRCLTGVKFTNSDDCFVGGDMLIENPITDGILTQRDAAWTAYMTSFSVGAVAIKGAPTAAAIDNAANITGVSAGRIRVSGAATPYVNFQPSADGPVRTKAGAPVDGDFPLAPPNGTMALDSTNHRFYVRDGGVWRYAALT